MEVAPLSDKGKSSKGGKDKSKKGGKGKERGEKSVTEFDGECRYCLKRRHKKSNCRKMMSEIAAGNCDRSGKPIGVNALSAAGATQPSPQASCALSIASTIPLQQMVPVCFQCPDGCQTSQPTETWYINMIVPAQKTHGCKLGRSRIRVVGFWLRLDVLLNQIRQRYPITAATCKLANLE